MLEGEEPKQYLFVTIMNKKNANIFHNFTLDD